MTGSQTTSVDLQLLVPKGQVVSRPKLASADPHAIDGGAVGGSEIL